MLIDSSLLSFGNNITDWQLGDDRIFTRQVSSSTLPTGDSLTNGFLTLKTSPTDIDSNALIQKHITTTATVAGQITGSPALNLQFNVFSADYQGLVSAGPVVYYDMRVLTSQGHTLTVETGTVEFQQNVTQTNTGGTPSVFPNDGLPRFRGFTATKPDSNPLNLGLFNAGDFYMNSNPSNLQGAGWQCTIGGQPGTWIPFGPAFTVANGGSLVVVVDGHFKGYASGPPLTGSYVTKDYFLNTNPASAQPEGWVCTAGGTPGTWNTKGIVGG